MCNVRMSIEAYYSAHVRILTMYVLTYVYMHIFPPFKAPMVFYKSAKEIPTVVVFSNLNTFIYRITAPQRFVFIIHIHVCECVYIYILLHVTLVYTVHRHGRSIDSIEQ